MQLNKGLKLLIIVVILGGVTCIGAFLFYKGILTLPEFATLGAEEEEVPMISIEDLKDGCYYVWHNPESESIKADLNGTTNMDAFKLCPKGTNNWDDNQWVNHTLWFLSGEDEEIPTYYEGDELIFISATTVPYEGIEWERIADYGYTIGVTDLIGDNSGHYHILLDVDNGYAGYLNPNSDAAELEQYVNVSELFLDDVGGTPVRDDNISEGGTVLGLEKDESYVCEWYTGTYFQDFKMKANTHAFCSLETFTTYDYEFLHSNCISITIPEWFKTGYYYVAGVGLFRYVSAEDAAIFNGQPYDHNIDWNDPIIIYNEDGFVEYDPTNPDTVRLDTETDPGIDDSEIGEETLMNESEEIRTEGEEDQDD